MHNSFHKKLEHKNKLYKLQTLKIHTAPKRLHSSVPYKKVLNSKLENNSLLFSFNSSRCSCDQCRGKLLLKVMHYNIALLPTFSYFLWKVMRYVTFALLSRYFLNMSKAWLFVFNTRSSIYTNIKAFSHQKV